MNEIDNLRFEGALKTAIMNAVKSLYNTELPLESVVLQETKKEFSGDATFVVFAITRFSGKTPEVTADEIGKFLMSGNFPLESYNVVKGFLNMSLAHNFWKVFFEKVKTDSDLLFSPAAVSLGSKPGYVMVEYSSPNTNKPLHLGHIRNILLGYSVAQILKSNGHKVLKANLVNDRGIHICKSMLAWEKYGNNETPSSTGIKGDHLVGKYYVLFDKKYKEQIEQLVKKGMSPEEAAKKAELQTEIEEMLRKWEAGDKHTIDLWKKMNGWVYDGFDTTYGKLGVDFDRIYYESETYLLGKKIVEQNMGDKKFFRADDGAIRIDLTDSGFEQKVVLRADGTSIYMTQDIGTAHLRFDDYPGLEKLIYVVGNEQDYHFKVLKEILKKLDRPWAGGLFHLSYGMVDLPSGKMKSREGTVVDADDLIDEIVEQAEMTTKAQGKLDDYDSAEAKELYLQLGMGALKYFILKVDPKKRMLFNPAESIDLNGNTGPFIQYTHARICSVLRKGRNVKKSNVDIQSHQLSKEEKALIQVIYRYPFIVHEAGMNLSPALVANYAYEVAKAYNHFYHNHVIVDDAQPAVSSFRLQLSELTASVIKESLKLLGIQAPERM